MEGVEALTHPVPYQQPCPWTVAIKLLSKSLRVGTRSFEGYKCTPVLWPPRAKSWLIGKDPDAGRDWGQEEKGTTKDEMAGWHHRLDGHEFEYTLGVGDGQGGLACYDSWGRKESDMTERLNWTDWSALCPPFPGKAIKLFFSTLPKTLVFKIPFSVGVQRLSFGHQSSCKTQLRGSFLLQANWNEAFLLHFYSIDVHFTQGFMYSIALVISPVSLIYLWDPGFLFS